jgi:hypothetical protein
LKVLVIVLIKVKDFYFCFWRLKVLAHTFGCWRFLFLCFYVKGYCFYSWILKVITFVFGCWRFLLLLLNVEGFCIWMYIKIMYIK